MPTLDDLLCNGKSCPKKHTCKRHLDFFVAVEILKAKRYKEICPPLAQRIELKPCESFIPA